MIFAYLCLLSLAAGDTAIDNKKVGVKEIVIDSPVAETHWCGKDSKEVLVRTRKGKIYRSDDFGENWKDITNDVSDKLVVQRLTGSPLDPNYVLAVSNKRVHFMSEDAGKTWRAITHSGAIHTYTFHPTDPKRALLSSWTDPCDNPKASGPCKHILYFTKDAGRTFQEVTSHVVQYSWGDHMHNQQDRIYFTHFRYNSGDQPKLTMWSQGVDFSYSDDGGYTSVKVVDQGNKFAMADGYIFVAKLKDPKSQTVSLEVSSDGAKSYRTARLPISLDEHSYTILDTSEGGVIIHVNHGHVGKDQAVGNVYVSDAEGVRFALSLPGNLRSPGGECEFDKVLSLEGVYLANMWDQSAIDSLDTDYDEDDDEESMVGMGRQQRVGKDESFVKTVLTMDKGGRWYYLNAPKVDSLGKPIECGRDCSLHLHGLLHTRTYAPFYSTQSATGLILGTGNVGPYLRYEKDEVNTYLSRDGGLSWQEIHKGAYIYEFGDHGGLIVMADDTARTKQVVFSWNEGASWFDFDVSTLQFEVDNIVTEPYSVSTKFVMYGTRQDAGVLYHLDFNGLNQPICKGIWAADSQSSDYETWSPTDGSRGTSGDQCLLGKQTTYTRRKQSSECFNGEETDKPVHRKTCECTIDDYMCELGFAREVGSSECKPADLDQVYLPEEIHCTTSGWFEADAYRKVLGDECVRGFQPSKVAVPCPPTSPFSRGAIIILVLIVLAVAALAILTYAGDNEKLRSFLDKYGINVESFKTVRYSTLGKSHIDEEADEFDADAPQLVQYSVAGLTKPQHETTLIELEGSPSHSVRMRAGGFGTATDSVPRLAAPNTKELDDIL